MVGVNDNPYAAGRALALERYAAHMEGAVEGLFCAVFSGALDESAREALAATAASLGYEGVTFVNAEGLAAKQLFELMEGLDPVALVSCDSAATLALTEAYRTLIAPGAPARVFGRDTRAFDNLAALMTTPESKQIAWSQLKTLPKAGM